MKTDVVYEITRLGKPFAFRLGILRSTPGGLLIYLGDHTVKLLWDNDDQFVDEEALGIVEVITNNERWVFNKLTLSNWEEMEPFFDPRIPEFDSDEAVNKYFYEALMREVA